jgi:hypothetical protein
MVAQRLTRDGGSTSRVPEPTLETIPEKHREIVGMPIKNANARFDTETEFVSNHRTTCLGNLYEIP